MLIVILCATLATLIVAAVVGLVFLDLAGHLDTSWRVSMIILAAGLVWGGADRFRQAPVGLGDLLFLVGLAGLLAAGFWRQFAAHIDAADGVVDGRWRFPPIIKS